MLKKIIQISPCTDWFFVADPESGGEIAEPVAAWGLLTNGTVIGLINDFNSPSGGTAPQLVPAISQDENDYPGDFVHRSQLTIGQRQALGFPMHDKP